MESLLKGKRFSIKEVVKTTVEVCHGNYKQFFLVNAVVIFVSMIATVLNTVVTTMITNPMIQILGFLGVMLVGIVAFYFSARLTIVMLYTVYDYLHESRRTFGEKYKNAGDVIWRYIGSSLLLGLMAVGFYIVMVIVIAVVVAISVNSEFTGGRIALMVIVSLACLAGMTVIGVKFYLGIFVRVFDQDNPSYFKESAQMVKGKFFQVLCLYMIPVLIQGPVIGLLVYLNIQQIINQVVYFICAIAVSIVTGPYMYCGLVIMYFLLRRPSGDEAALEVIEAAM